MINEGELSPGTMERRRKPRFPFVEIARYRFLDPAEDRIGIAQTVNLSASGALLRVQNDLRVGGRLELCAGALIARGRVIRSDNGCAAIAFDEAVWAAEPIPAA